MERRVVVFGGTGFIGQHVVRACADADFATTVAVRPGGRVENLAALQERIAVIAADFTVPSEVRRALSGATDAVVLVGTTVPATAVNDPTHELFATVMPHIHFLGAAVEAGVRRVVVASSGGTVYGTPRFLPIPEDHPLQPITPYGIAKLTIESYCAFYRHQYRLDARVLRIANPYGPGQRVESGQGIVGTAFSRLLTGEPMSVYGDGSVSRDFIYVEDVADAFVRLLRYEGDEWVFNVGSGEAIALHTLLSTIEAVSGRAIVREVLPPRAFDVHANALDTTRARVHLGWRGTVPLREGLRRTWAAILDAP